MLTVSNAFEDLLQHHLKSFIIKALRSIDGSAPYVDNWHIDVIADALVRAYRGEIQRLIICLPPRSLKSIAVSVAFPAWVLGHDPTARLVCASYSGDLAAKHGRDCRSVMGMPWYGDAFPDTHLNPNKSAETDFETTVGGGRLATSVGGTLTGRGGGFVIIDDPIKAQDALSATHRDSVHQWITGTAMTRLDDKRTGVVIVVMQRVHIDDPVGRLLEQGGWTVVSLPAIAEEQERFELLNGQIFTRAPGDVLQPEREPIEVLDRLRAEMGPYWFDAQYQQRPVPESGNLVRWEWFRTYTDVPARGSSYRDRIVQSWDVAMSERGGADWSVCTTWAMRGADYYLVDIHRKRLSFPALKRKILEYKKAFAADVVIIEDAGIGTGLIQQLKAETDLRPVALRPEGDKADRMAAQSAAIEAGHVLLPESAPWLAEFRAELAAFPHGRHDDQVDSLSQFLIWATNRQKYEIPVVMPGGNVVESYWRSM